MSKYTLYTNKYEIIYSASPAIKTLGKERVV